MNVLFASIVRGFLPSLLLVLLPLAASSQHLKNGRDELRLPARIFTSNDGLGGATITSLVKDSRGFLWIGTPDELLLYDGLRFVPFRYHDSGHAATPFRRAVVLQAGIDTFLILHEGGGHQYVQRSGMLQRVTLPFPFSGLLLDASLIPDSTPGWYRLITGTMGARYHPQTARWSYLTQHTLQRVAHDVSSRGRANLYFDRDEQSLRLSEPSSHKLLFNYRFPFAVQSVVRLHGGLLILDSNKRQHLWWLPDGKALQMLLTVSRPARDLRAVVAGAKVYVAAEANLYRFDPSTGHATELLAEDGSQLISKGYATRFLADGRTLWVGTNASGLLRLSPEGLRFRHIRSPVPAHNFVNAILPDLKGNRIYTGAFSGAFIAYDTSGTLQEDLSRRLRADSTVWSLGFNHIERRPNGSLFIVGGHTRACLFYPKTGVVVHLTGSVERSLENVGQPPALQPGRQTVCRAGSDEWWITAKNGLGLWKLSGQGAQSHLELLRFIQLPPPVSPEGICYYNGSWWCATAGKLYRIGSSGIIDSSTLPVSSLVTCMQPDREGRLWIATENGVMLWRNGRTERILTAESGLANSHVYTLLPDSAGWMWGATNGGLFAVRTSDFRVRTFTSGDGLQGAEFNSGAAAVDAQGRFYFGGMNGINVFYPAAALREDAAGPVTITKVASPDTVYYTYPGAAMLPRLYLAHDRANLQLTYTAALPSASGQRQYEYRLRDDDTAWTDNGSDGELQLYLAPGSYHIQVRLQGAPKSTAEVLVDVAPPFYRTAWFILLIILLGGAAVAAIFIGAARARYRRQLARLETARHVQQEKERISRDLHDELGARAALLAHNAGMLGSAAQQQTQTSLLADRIAETAVDMLTALRETVWTLKQETVTAESLWLRYKNFIVKLGASYTAIHFAVEEDSILPATPLDYTRALNLLRILQEATMNAVKHSGASMITATARLRENGLQFSVSDNGQGFDIAAMKAAGEGNGLHNMEQRSREADLALSIRRGDSGGTVITVYIQ